MHVNTSSILMITLLQSLRLNICFLGINVKSQSECYPNSLFVSKGYLKILYTCDLFYKTSHLIDHSLYTTVATKNMNTGLLWLFC